MPRITIVRVDSPQSPGSHREYCGRPGKGQKGTFGNPFWMSDESQRNWLVIRIKITLKLRCLVVQVIFI
jgi:hypothetical protein